MARLLVNQVFHPCMNIVFSHHRNCSAADVLSIPSVWHVKFTYQLLGCWCILHQRVRQWKNKLWHGKKCGTAKVYCMFVCTVYLSNKLHPCKYTGTWKSPWITCTEAEPPERCYFRKASRQRYQKQCRGYTSGVSSPLYCSHMHPSCFWITSCCYFVRDNMACIYEKRVHFSLLTHVCEYCFLKGFISLYSLTLESPAESLAAI